MKLDLVRFVCYYLYFLTHSLSLCISIPSKNLLQGVTMKRNVAIFYTLHFNKKHIVFSSSFFFLSLFLFEHLGWLQEHKLMINR